jgi:uncharacterized caspase-like protein
MMRKALVIGNDDYLNSPLNGCVNDANGMANLLSRHGNGDPNFDVNLALNLTNSELREQIGALFSGKAEIALLYFAGHGLLDAETNGGYLVGTNGSSNGWGMSFPDILELANKGIKQGIQSVVIIVDCCHAGALGDIQGQGTTGQSTIGDGITILTACERNQTSAEDPLRGQGVFTELAIDALAGGGADIIGRVTPASVYNHIDQALGAWQQRPVYKANVSKFIELRSVEPKVRREILRDLSKYFESPSSIYPLDPSYEKTDPSAIDENVKIFTDLQKCNRASLISPVQFEDMYFAAINSTGCRLTVLGAHYYRLAKEGKI